jgi:uncharacterized C2H2 Zn-finger protein
MSNNVYSITNIVSYDNMILTMLNTIATSTNNNIDDDNININVEHQDQLIEHKGQRNNKNNIISSNIGNSKIMCPYCEFSFLNENSLNLHLNKCFASKKFNKISGSITFNSVIDSNYELVNPPSLYDN